MRLQALGRLAGIARCDQPPRLISRRMSSASGTLSFDLDVLEHLVGEAELLGQEVHDFVIVLASKIGSTIFSPHCSERLEAVREPVHLELGADRQQIRAVLALGEQRGEGGRMRIGDDQQFELLHALHDFRDAGDGVAAVAEHHHGLAALSFWSTWSFGSKSASNQRVDGMPGVSIILRLASARTGRSEQPIVVDVPDPAPMPPGAFDKAVVERQRHDIEAEVGRALHVVWPRKMLAPVPGLPTLPVASSRMQKARTLAVPTVCCVGAHAPDQRRGLLRGEQSARRA